MKKTIIALQKITKTVKTIQTPRTTKILKKTIIPMKVILQQKKTK